MGELDEQKPRLHRDGAVTFNGRDVLGWWSHDNCKVNGDGKWRFREGSLKPAGRQTPPTLEEYYRPHLVRAIADHFAERRAKSAPNKDGGEG